MWFSNSIKVLPFIFFTVLAGCTKASPPTIHNLSEAQVAFNKICKEEFKLNPVINLVGNTLWVYVPFEKPIYDIKLDGSNEKEKEKGPKPPPKSSSLLYIDGNVENKSFHFQYDITPSTQSGKPLGFGTIFTEDFSKAQNDILTALYRSFFEVKAGVPTPDFAVIVICDIQKGLEVKNTFYMEDLRQYALNFLPQEEYLQRYIQDTSGNKSFIGDKEGRHLDFKPIEWPDFLLKQIINRVQFKYQSSDFPPGEDAENEILKIVNQVFEIYKFKDYESVKLSNLFQKKNYTFSPSQIKTFTQ